MANSVLPKAGISLLALWVYLLPVAAEEPAASAPWEDWQCKYCLDTTGTEGWIEPGIGYLSEDSYKFGRYTGLKDEGVFGDLSGFVQHREDDGRYYIIRGRNLGLDSRDIQIEGGQQGNYELFLQYDELPSFNDDTTSSPYLEQGGSLLLSPGWVPAASTQNMTTLQQDLTSVTIKTKRKRLQAKYAYLPFKRWEVTAHLLHEKKDGRQDLGTTFGFGQTAILPVPVDYQTNEFGIGIGYTGKKLQAQLAYDGSFFREENGSGQAWQNPYVDSADPTAFGQYARAPDNNYHKLSATLGYNVVEHTRLNAHLSVGWLSQDENFLPYTINSGLGSPLPTSDLDGNVKNTLIRLGVSSRPRPRLQLNANYTFSDRDNYSSRASYDYVVTDLFNVATARQNLPYSFKQHLFRSNVAYRLSNRSKMSLGVDYDKMERKNQEVEDTEDYTVWGKLKFRPHENVDASIKYSYADRDNSAYGSVAQIIPPQNPLLRLYNLAERTRNKLSGALSITPTDTLTLGLSADYYEDDYDDTAVGLTKTTSTSYTVDLSHMISENLTATAYYTREVLESDQAGSQGFATADWFLDDENTSDTVGMGINWSAIPDKLVIGADLVYADYNGEINYASAAAYPDLESNLKSARLHSTWKMKENLSIKLAYRYEDYSEDDWAKDGIDVDTLPTVLGLGDDTQDYDVHAVAISVRYDFE